MAGKVQAGSAGRPPALSGPSGECRRCAGQRRLASAQPTKRLALARLRHRRKLLFGRPPYSLVASWPAARSAETRRTYVALTMLNASK